MNTFRFTDSQIIAGNREQSGVNSETGVRVRFLETGV